MLIKKKSFPLESEKKYSIIKLIDKFFQSIERAHNAMVPGRLFITHGEVHGVNINRSPFAYLNNPKAERDKYKILCWSIKIAFDERTS